VGESDSDESFPSEICKMDELRERQFSRTSILDYGASGEAVQEYLDDRPALAWEVDLSDWPRTPQKLQGSLAEAGRKRMLKAQEAAKRSVDSPRTQPQAPQPEKSKASKASKASKDSKDSKDSKHEGPRSGRSSAWEIDMSDLQKPKPQQRLAKPKPHAKPQAKLQAKPHAKPHAETRPGSRAKDKGLGEYLPKKSASSSSRSSTPKRAAETRKPSPRRLSGLHLCDGAATPDI